MRRILPLLSLLALLAGCTGDFDQRVDVARLLDPGEESLGTATNPKKGNRVRGNVSTGGLVRGGVVTLRRINTDGTIETDDTKAIGLGVLLSNGSFDVAVRENGYRGPVLVEIRGNDSVTALSEAANPATGRNRQFHDFRGDHILCTILPYFDGQDNDRVHITPLTTTAVARCGFLGGYSAGMFGLVCRQLAAFFSLEFVRGQLPTDFSKTNSAGDDKRMAYVIAALSQLALNLGVYNVMDFYRGMFDDASDNGQLDGSIGFVPNTGVAMPDLGQANLLGNALFDDYLDPANIERRVGVTNLEVSPGSELDLLIDALNSARTIGSVSFSYELCVRVPKNLALKPGASYQTRTLALERIGLEPAFEPYGDSSGPSFVSFAWAPSNPGITISPEGLLSIGPAVPKGRYTVALTVSPAPAQTFVTGPALNFSFVVEVK